MRHLSPAAVLRGARGSASPLRLEALEPRCLLSVNITFVAGALSVVGDAAIDWIQVTDNGDGTAVVAVPTDPLHALPAPFAGVTSITVDTGGGQNRVDYLLDAAAVAPGAFAPADLTLLGGAFNDRLFLTQHLPAVQSVPGQTANVVVDLGGGKNVLLHAADGAAPALPGESSALVALWLTGGASKDSATLSFTGLFTNVTIDTGTSQGKDAVTLSYADVPVGMPSNLAATLSEGNDVFRLSAASAVPGDPASDGMNVAIDGLGGNDAVSMSFFDIFADVSLDMGLGNDSATIGYTGLAGDHFSSVLADMGEGNDRLGLTASALFPGVPPNTGVFLSFGGFGGNDAATMSFTDVPTLLLLDGDLGNDKMSATYRGVPADSLVMADLGEGRNSFQLDARANPADLPGFAPGALDVQVLGGEAGNATNLAFSHVFATVSVDTGAGNDSTTVSFDALPVGLTAPVTVDMGDGGNVFQILANGLPPAGPPVGARGAVALSLNGGIGSDAASMSFFDVFTTVTANLGVGSNSASILLDAPVSLANGGAGTVGVNTLFVQGGVGADRLSLTLGSPAGSAGAVAALGSVAALLDAGGGNNSVAFTVGGDIAFGQDIAATVTTGAGNDIFNVTARSIFADGALRVAADTGAGLDAFNGLVVADVNGTGLVDIAVGLGAATDDANLEFRGQINGDVRLLVDGADGNDTLQTYIIPTVGSVGRLDAELRGGLNNDELSFLVSGLQNDLPFLLTNLLADGGPNFDVAFAVNGVTLLNIEEPHTVPEPTV
ncbi:MAG: hypothetical protein FJ291_22600 [Planctomycetes bacterium]|nr:hypothetical protein [Planctomycetota bacterium]